MLTDEQIERLAQPLPDEFVKAREGGGGRSVSYVEAWRMKQTANEVFGFAEWGYRTLDIVFLGEETVQRQRRDKDGNPLKPPQIEEGTRVAYRALVQVKVNGVIYSDWGYGEDVSYTSALQPHELATKEAVSDGLKRALNPLGPQFGLELYDKENPQSRGDRGRRARVATPRGGQTLASQRDISGVHAHRNELGVSDEVLHRLVPFVAQDAEVTSMKMFPRRYLAALRTALADYAADPEKCDEILTAWELSHGGSADPVEPDVPS